MTLMLSAGFPSEPGFAAAELAPLTQVLSKLGPIVIVKDSRFYQTRLPHFCWIASEPLSRVTPSVLAHYPGRGRWTVVSDVPRVCLVASPKAAEIEHYFGAGTDTRVSESIEKGDAAKSEPKNVKEAMNHFRSDMLDEIPKLAKFIENFLEIQNKTSLGVSFSDDTLELPEFEDRPGPGGGVILVRDPKKFVETGLPTSQFDRATHFWLTEEEASSLLTELARGESSSTELSTLRMIAQSGYGGLALSNDDVTELGKECEFLNDANTSPAVHSALEKLFAIYRSAQAYSLGIFIPGN